MEQPRRFDVEPPRRVLIVGNRGSGKRALARLLAERYGLSMHVIEAEGQASAGMEHQEQRRQDLSEHAKGTYWAMTADDPWAFDTVVPRAEWLVWIDLPVSTCLASAIRQAIRFRRARRSGKGVAMPQRGPRLRDVLNFPGEVTPRIMSMIDRERRNRTIFILRSKAEVAAFVKRLPGPGTLDDHLRPGSDPNS